MSYENGDKYVGKWLNGNPSGAGVMSYNSGNKYDGHWLEGEYDGIGTLSCANGESFEGKWANGLFTYGTYTAVNGDIYKGLYESGAFNSQCEIIYANGDKYSGGVLQSRESGLGKMVYANGDTSLGTWQDGAFISGRHSKNGVLYQDGTWKDGVFFSGKKYPIYDNLNLSIVSLVEVVKNGVTSTKIDYSDETRYVGDVEGSHRNGSGVFYGNQKSGEYIVSLDGVWGDDNILAGEGRFVAKIAKASLAVDFTVTQLPEGNRRKLEISTEGYKPRVIEASIDEIATLAALLSRETTIYKEIFDKEVKEHYLAQAMPLAKDRTWSTSQMRNIANNPARFSQVFGGRKNTIIYGKITNILEQSETKRYGEYSQYSYDDAYYDVILDGVVVIRSDYTDAVVDHSIGDWVYVLAKYTGERDYMEDIPVFTISYSFDHPLMKGEYTGGIFKTVRQVCDYIYKEHNSESVEVMEKCVKVTY